MTDTTIHLDQGYNKQMLQPTSKKKTPTPNRFDLVRH